MKQRPKNKLDDYRLLCNSGSTNFILLRPAKVSYHKRELQEQGIKHAFEAHAICRWCLLLALSAEAFQFTLARGSQSFSPTGSLFSDRGGECSSSFRCLCLRFRLCRLLWRSVASPGERDRWRRLWCLWVFSVSSPDSLALTEGSFAGSKAQDEL
jgi:hypothetical protein